MFLTSISTRFISHIIQASSKRTYLSAFSAVFHTRAHFAALDEKASFPAENGRASLLPPTALPPAQS